MPIKIVKKKMQLNQHISVAYLFNRFYKCRICFDMVTAIRYLYTTCPCHCSIRIVSAYARIFLQIV